MSDENGFTPGQQQYLQGFFSGLVARGAVGSGAAARRDERPSPYTIDLEAQGRVACGDARRMAKDVDTALTLLVACGGGMSQGAAKAWMADLARPHRYLRDVY